MTSRTMRALVHHGTGVADTRPADVPVPAPGPGEVLVALTASALNHRDLFVAAARTAADPPLVLGSDGVGVIAEVGPGGNAAAVGRRVLIDPCLGWRRASEVPEVPAILGGPSQGTFAEFVAVPAVNVHPVPAHLTDHEAAALPLAGLTAYRGLFTQAAVAAGQHVVIPGIGGGVALLALQMAVAAGAEVTVTSRSADKADRALTMGAAAAVGTPDYDAQLRRPADVVLDSIGSATFAAGMRALRPGGSMVSFGATTGADVSLSLRDLFFRQVRLIGTSMGSAEEFAAMLEFVGRHRIRPIVEAAMPLADGRKALACLQSGDVFGKLVLIP